MDLMDKECPDTDRGIGCTGRMRTSGVGMSDRCGRCAQALPVEDGRRASGEIASVETLFEEGDERRQEGLRLGAGRQVEMADQAVLFDGGVAARSGAFGPRKRVVGVHVERLAHVNVGDGQRHHCGKQDLIARFSSHRLSESTAKVTKNGD